MRTGIRIVATGVIVAAAVAGTMATVAIVDAATRDDAFVIDRFDREVVVRPDGTMDVTETIEVTFLEPRRGIFRDLEAEGPAGPVTYDVESVDRGPDRRPWNWVEERTDTDEVRIRVGDAAVFLDPGPQRYRFRYTIADLTFEHTDDPELAEVRIDVPGDRWPTQVEATQLTVRLPTEPTAVACVVGRRGATDPCPDTEVSGTTVTQQLPPLHRNSTGTVSIELPRTAFDGRLPRAEVRPLGSGHPFLPFVDVPPHLGALLAAGLIALPVIVLELLKALFLYRDRVTDAALHDRVAPSAEFVPPDGRAPVELAGLLQREVGTEALLATLVDLELRGAVVSTTSGQETTKQKEPVVTFEPGDATGPLRPWEASFVGDLLPGGSPITFDGTFDEDTAGRVMNARAHLRRRAKELLGRGSPLIHEEASWLRGCSGVLFGLLVLLLCGFLAYAGTVVFGLAYDEVGIIVAILFVAWFAIRGVWRYHRLPLSSEGRDAIARARAFRSFLSEVHADRLQFAAAQGVHSRHPALELLPHAVALGLAASWYRRFEPLLAELAAAGQAPSSDSGTWYLHRSTFDGTSSSYSSSTSTSSSSGGAGSGGGGGGGGSW